MNPGSGLQDIKLGDVMQDAIKTYSPKFRN